MSKEGDNQRSQDDPKSPETESQNDTHINPVEDPQSEQEPQTEPDDQQSRSAYTLPTQLQVRSSPFIHDSGDSKAITAWLGGSYLGTIILNNPIDLRDVVVPPGGHLSIGLDKARLIIVPSLTSSTSSNLPRTEKRKASEDNSDKANKRPKRVARNAPPIAQKPASAYARGVEQPNGMTKKEEDACLTCIRYNRKCKGTNLHMVKGSKRCETCAFPGKSTCSRICIWKDRSRGVDTYEEGQQKVSKELGGRILQGNTREGRLKRQQDSDGEPSSADSAADEDETDDEEFGGEEWDESQIHDDMVITNDDSNDPDMSSAVVSAHQSLYGMIARDLGLPNQPDSITNDLGVNRTIRGALEGWGSHQNHIVGIDGPVRHAMWGFVNNIIAELEERMRRGDF